MIQITETQARIFSKLISKIISDYEGVNDAFIAALKVLRNDIDGKIAESEQEQEQLNVPNKPKREHKTS